MYKYYIFIASLGVSVVVLSILIFSIAGNPFRQQLIKLDSKRLSEFSKINIKIESYFQTNKKLPSNLSELDNLDKNLPIVDSETKKQYEYKIVSNSSYELCTEFSVDSKETADSYYDSQRTTHTKGYDCIPYTLPSYLLNSGQNTYLSPPPYDSQAALKRRRDINAILNAVKQYMADNKEIIPGAITTFEKEISKSGADLCSTLVPTYMVGLPADSVSNANGRIMDCATPYLTGYTIMKDEQGKITVKALYAEGETIQVTR